MSQLSPVCRSLGAASQGFNLNPPFWSRIFEGLAAFTTKTSSAAAFRGFKSLATIPETPPGAYGAESGREASHMFSVKWHNKLGKIFRDHDMNAYFISCPKMCEDLLSSGTRYPRLFIPPAWSLHHQITKTKRGLLFMEGEQWWQARRMLNPLLLKNCAVAGMSIIIQREVDNLIQYWKQRIQPGEDLQKDLYRWLVRSMIEMFLGDKTLDDQEVEEVSERILEDVRGVFDTTNNLMLIDMKDSKNRQCSDWLKFCGHLESIMNMLTSMVRDRHGQLGGVAGQLLSAGMEEDEVEKYIADLMLGGADTTALTASWILTALAENQEVQERVREEVEEVCGNETASIHHLAKLSLTKGFLKEVMRVYPVVPFLTRILSDSTRIQGYTFPKDSLIVISSYFMGRNPQIFPEPDNVRPERWCRQSAASSERSSMSLSVLPFGHGVRSCIGRRIAETELQLLTARLLQEYKLSTDSKAEYVTRMVGVNKHKPDIQFHQLRRSSPMKVSVV